VINQVCTKKVHELPWWTHKMQLWSVKHVVYRT
jgi:hypothetical protein